MGNLLIGISGYSLAVLFALFAYFGIRDIWRAAEADDDTRGFVALAMTGACLTLCALTAWLTKLMIGG